MSREERVAKRYKDCIDEDFDSVFLRMRKGIIKCGKYANSVKRQKIGKVLFGNGEKDHQRK